MLDFQISVFKDENFEELVSMGHVLWADFTKTELKNILRETLEKEKYLGNL